jgi:hypothetical protein
MYVAPSVSTGALILRTYSGLLTLSAAIAGIEAESVNKPEYVLKIKAPVETDGATYIQTFKAESAMNKSNAKGSFAKNTPNIKVEQAQTKKNKRSSGDSYSNFLRVKTVYELAMEANPTMFLPHDEFETADEYKKRVSDQVSLMKEIVQMTSQKMEIKKAQRLQVAKGEE